MAGKRGAPLGNNNGAKAFKRPWKAAILRALEKRSLQLKRDALDELAETLLKACDEMDIAALKELGDRLEGKSVQQIDATVDATVTVELIRFADTTPE